MPKAKVANVQLSPLDHRLSHPHLFQKLEIKNASKRKTIYSKKFNEEHLKAMFDNLLGENAKEDGSLTVEQAYLFSCMTLVSPQIGDFEEVVLSIKAGNGAENYQSVLKQHAPISFSITNTQEVDFKTFMIARKHFEGVSSNIKEASVFEKILMLIFIPFTSWASFFGVAKAKSFMWKIMAILQFSYSNRLRTNKRLSLGSFILAIAFTLWYTLAIFTGAQYGVRFQKVVNPPDCFKHNTCEYLFLHEPPSNYENITVVATPKLSLCHTTYTTLEATGPLLLMIISMVTLGSFATDNDISVETAPHRLFHRLGGFSKPIQTLAGSNTVDTTVGAVVMGMVNAYTPSVMEKKKWAKWHNTTAIIMTIPYFIVPFLTRYRHGCIVFWHWHWPVNVVMYGGGLLNFLLAYEFIHLLLHAYYVFRQKLVLMRKLHLMLYDDDEDMDFDIELFHNKDNVVGWFLINYALSEVKSKVLARFDKLITGLGLVFVVWLGFFYSMAFGGWALNIDGTNVSYIAGYTVLMAGGYIIFPILSYGIRINLVIDNIKERLHDLTWMACAMDAKTQHIWTAIRDRYIGNTEYLKILWVIPLSPDLLKTMVTLIATTAFSAVYSQATGD